jgi:hypothetical protein
VGNFMHVAGIGVSYKGQNLPCSAFTLCVQSGVFADLFAERERFLRIGRPTQSRGVSPAVTLIDAPLGDLNEWMAQ